MYVCTVCMSSVDDDLLPKSSRIGTGMTPLTMHLPSSLCVHMYVHTCVCLNVCVCMYVCMYVCMGMGRDVCICMYVCTSVCLNVCVCM